MRNCILINKGYGYGWRACPFDMQDVVNDPHVTFEEWEAIFRAKVGVFRATDPKQMKHLDNIGNRHGVQFEIAARDQQE